MHIVFAASECVPFAQTGGLGNVVGELPPELVKLGHAVTVYLPLYKSARAHLPEKLTYAVRSITIPFPYYNRFVGIVDGGVRDGVRYYFVDCPELFDREGIYGPKDGAGDYGDNAERYGLYCRAILETVKLLGVPDVFHVHDWAGALLPVLLRSVYYFDAALKSAGTVLTVHNAAYQGVFAAKTIEQLLLPWDLYTPEKLEQDGAFNTLKGGVVYADAVTTVSPTYALEVQTPEFGSGLDGVFRRRSGELGGILNGVDYRAWDPSRDGKLAAHYSAERLEGKAECRKDLLHAFGLDGVAGTTAVVGIVSRLATQKGMDLLMTAADQFTERDLVLVVLGTGEPYYESFFRGWAQRKPQQVAVQLKYDEALAHKVEAGSDVYLAPSRYEPCGLNQLYSMKYGTVPVVRATGGLEDTVSKWDGQTGTGFKFSGYAPGDLLGAVDRALAVFEDKAAWTALMRNGMAEEFGWERPAKEYVAVYEDVLRRRG